MSGLKILSEELNGGVAYFELQGYLDAHNFEKLETVFEKHFAEEVYRFVVDIRRLEYVSSAGAGVFIGAVGTCQDNGGNIVLVQPSQEVKEIFELLGVYQIFPVLKKKEKALAQTLSGGEQQMLVICRSLMSNPQLLILDEPSLGLAPIIVEKVLDTVRKINEEGVTILLVEQNIRDSLDIADRGYVLEQGKIILEGKSRELLCNNHIKQVYMGL